MANERIGDMDFRTYYSTTLPRGSKAAKETEWDVDTSVIFNKVTRMIDNNATPEDVHKAQIRLVELGYLEPHLVDGMRGPITDGAIHRWQLNTNDDIEMYWYEVGQADDPFSKAASGIRGWWQGK
tara:strand:+ start:5471 stop:5845 length:375 start_codon:yes stop_codon:yes gene_type:complete